MWQAVLVCWKWTAEPTNMQRRAWSDHSLNFIFCIKWSLKLIGLKDRVVFQENDLSHQRSQWTWHQVTRGSAARRVENKGLLSSLSGSFPACPKTTFLWNKVFFPLCSKFFVKRSSWNSFVFQKIKINTTQGKRRKVVSSRRHDSA